MSEIGILDISFEDLQIVIESFKPMPLCPRKRSRFNVFAKLHESPLSVANILGGEV